MSKTNNWKAFGGKYLQADQVENNTDKYVIKNVNSEDEDGRETIIFTLEREGVTKLFGCNVTNEQAVKAACPENPDQALGRVVVFNKVKTRNPSTGQEVDGLRIVFVPVVTEVPIPAESGISADGTM